MNGRMSKSDEQMNEIEKGKKKQLNREKETEKAQHSMVKRIGLKIVDCAGIALSALAWQHYRKKLPS